MATINRGRSGKLTPHIMILNNRAAEVIDFYQAAFGAEERVPMLAEDGQWIMRAHRRVNGASVMLNDAFPEFRGPGATPEGPPAGIVLPPQVDDADRWFHRAVAAAGTSRMAPQDMLWGKRYSHVGDPFGPVRSIASPIR